MEMFTSLLTEREAALILSVSARTLQAWRVSGGGPEYVKLGRAVRFHG
ncbi:helix-turn-helix domain-containing protein [Thiohalocapsa marina]|uniref:Helix-turn-helix domain-containing protein n=1 Tax=Thiohalocapsa marina TaxID=424902 RepID=A0A5M8FA95_9GAMM|nr:helix-turn-helix domain-containing protein [Thiohalocapsa marina]